MKFSEMLVEYMVLFDEEKHGGWVNCRRRKRITELLAEMDKLVAGATLYDALAATDICTHDETHRGGAIWTICDQCGKKWADDEVMQPQAEPVRADTEAVQRERMAMRFAGRAPSPATADFDLPVAQSVDAELLAAMKGMK